MYSHIDFAYPWYLSYGHLLVAAIALASSIGIWMRKWSKVLLVLTGALTLWAGTAGLLVRFGFDLNGRAAMPTENFLKGGGGKVLDMGAGTGRSSIMVLEARPKTTVVGLDLFTESYEEHFGKGFSGQEKLLANLRAAGLESRATIQAGDMRKLPFENATFDGIVSSYAIDHLGHDGINDALHEASRVLKPGGEFLMMVIAKDRWLTYTFGPLLMHARMRASSTWPMLLKDAGFDMVEEGTRPATLYYVARKHG
jgi:ubiquinone/menaquinone biosynthesis C-methylase UbiE